MSPERIMTIPQLVQRLGGAGEVAGLFGIVDTAVMNWIAFDRIPSGWHLRLYLIAQDRGLDVSLRCFGLPDAPAWPKPSVDA